MIGGILRITRAVATNRQAGTVVDEICALQQRVQHELGQAAEFHDRAADVAVRDANEALEWPITEQTLKTAVDHLEQDNLAFEFCVEDDGGVFINYRVIADQALIDHVSQRRDLGRFLTTVGLTGVTVSVIGMAVDFQRGYEIGGVGADLLDAAGDGADFLDLAGAIDPFTLMASLGLSGFGRYLQKDARQKLEEATALARSTVPDAHREALVAAHLIDRGESFRALAEAIELHLVHAKGMGPECSTKRVHWYRRGVIAHLQALGLAVHSVNDSDITTPDGTYSEQSREVVAGSRALAANAKVALRNLRRRLWMTRAATAVTTLTLGMAALGAASPLVGLS